MDFEILFVDDDSDILSIVQKYLSRQGYNITVLDNGIDALSLVKQKNFDIVFTDFKMPEFDGLELLVAIKEYRPETEVVIVTGYGTMESAIKAMKFGSYDYIQKPFKLETLKILIDKVMEEKKFLAVNAHLKRKIKDKQRHRYGDLIGMSLKMQAVYEILDSIGPDDPFVLITGESGTGKELVGRMIHQRGARKDGPFIPVNCGSVEDGIPDEKLADYMMGLIEASRGGTLYFDELTELAPSLQGLFFQVLSHKQMVVGGNQKTLEVDARIIAASKMDLDDAMENGRLRKDLYQLFSAVLIQMPPLRERKEDICLLLNHFLYTFNSAKPQKIGGVSPEALDILLDYHWPGNVIQLGNVIERAFAIGVDGMIKVSDLPPEVRTFAETSIKIQSK
jgi:DNA-binding NtrC family response regulator